MSRMTNQRRCVESETLTVLYCAENCSCVVNNSLIGSRVGLTFYVVLKSDFNPNNILS